MSSEQYWQERLAELQEACDAWEEEIEIVAYQIYNHVGAGSPNTWILNDNLNKPAPTMPRITYRATGAGLG